MENQDEKEHLVRSALVPSLVTLVSLECPECLENPDPREVMATEA